MSKHRTVKVCTICEKEITCFSSLRRCPACNNLSLKLKVDSKTAKKIRMKAYRNQKRKGKRGTHLVPEGHEKAICGKVPHPDNPPTTIEEEIDCGQCVRALTKMKLLNGDITTVPCRICKEEFVPSPSRIKNSKWICSKCQYYEMKKNPSLLKSVLASAKRYNQSEAGKKYHREAKAKRRNMPGEAAKNKARAALRYAVKAGKVKQLPCEHPDCSEQNTQGHHEDYSKPLEVEWLCQEHHTELHNNQNSSHSRR